MAHVCVTAQGPVSRKSPGLFGPEKPFIKLRLAYPVKLVFSYVVKGIKIQITAKFRASRRLCFEDTKKIKSLEEHPKRFGTFEKRARVQECSRLSINLRVDWSEIFPRNFSCKSSLSRRSSVWFSLNNVSS